MLQPLAAHLLNVAAGNQFAEVAQRDCLARRVGYVVAVKHGTLKDQRAHTLRPRGGITQHHTSALGYPQQMRGSTAVGVDHRIEIIQFGPEVGMPG